MLDAGNPGWQSFPDTQHSADPCQRCSVLLSPQKPSVNCDPRSVEKSSLAFASHFAEIFDQ